MTRRTRTVLAASAAALAVAGPAAAAPGTPVLKSAPDFAQGASITPSWNAVTFSALSKDRGYEVQVDDLTVASAAIFPAGADTDVTIGGRLNGHRYRVRVRAVETPCVAPGVGVCLFYAPLSSAGAWSAPEYARMDQTDPTGSVAVNGGAAYATSRDVVLNLSASDPPSAGNPASGIDGVEISQDASFGCNVITAPAECPVPVLAARPYTLDEGPDGVRTVRVRYRDGARLWSGPSLLVSLGAKGNASAVAQDAIILDRSLPTPVVTMGVPSADAGVPVAFSAVSSTDATSGVDTSSAVWDFGDGAGPVNALQLNKSFANPGTYNGSLTIKDKAGNTNTQAFSFTVTGAPAPGGGGVTVTDPGTGSPGVAPAADDPIRGAKRLNRAVQGKKLRIRVRVANRVQVRVAILRVSSSGKAVVRRQTKTGGPGLLVFTFTAPRAGSHVVRITAGSDRLTFPMGIARR